MTTRTHRAVRTNEDMLVYQEAEQDDFALELDNESIVDSGPDGTTIGSPLDASYDQRLQAAQEQLQQLRQQQEAVERQKRELEELSHKQRNFVVGRTDLTNNFSRSIAMLEREAAEARKRADQYDATRENFEQHYRSISGLKPETWDRARLRDELGQALSMIEDASEDYEKQIAKVDIWRGSTSRASHVRTDRSNSASGAGLPTGFKQWFMMGLAVTLPVTVLGTLALIAYAIF